MFPVPPKYSARFYCSGRERKGYVCCVNETVLNAVVAMFHGSGRVSVSAVIPRRRVNLLYLLAMREVDL